MPVNYLCYGPQVGVICATKGPAAIILAAAQMTQLPPQVEGPIGPKAAVANRKKLIRCLIEAGHTSVFEHVSITFQVSSISRACADQLMRHRLCAFTCSSTHYADHKYAGMVLPYRMHDDDALAAHFIRSIELYNKYKSDECVGPEARQILPLATEVRLMWTVNARELLYILRLRSCKRNMAEIRALMDNVRVTAINWFPELFDNYMSEPACMRTGTCDQGAWTCGSPK